MSRIGLNFGYQLSAPGIPFPHQFRISTECIEIGQLFWTICFPESLSPRNVGTPLSADMPAPVRTAIFCAVASLSITGCKHMCFSCQKKRHRKLKTENWCLSWESQKINQKLFISFHRFWLLFLLIDEYNKVLPAGLFPFASFLFLLYGVNEEEKPFPHRHHRISF